MTELEKGGCFCGSIRYAFEQRDYPSGNCHCSMCRRTSAAPFVPWLAVPLKHFKYTKGQPKTLNSSSHGTRYFCEDCGTPLACILEKDPENIDVTICSLDQPERFAPKANTYVDTQLPWIDLKV